MTYKEKLLDPRWQRKRLEILESDYWRCRVCESKTGTLHVHHLWYAKDCDPWDYPNECLVTLCDKCHEKAPRINWRQALLDLNPTEADLLSLAATLAFLKAKHSEISKAHYEKYKMRPNLGVTLSLIDFFDDTEELMRFFDFEKEFKKRYTDE